MKIFLDTIGCRLNLSEVEKIASQFRAEGHEIVENAGQAEIVIINTCGVTSKASADSRNAIRRAQRAGNNQIIATGCWATMEPEKALSLTGVHSVISNTNKDRFVTDLLDLPKDYEFQISSRIPLPGNLFRTRAFIKVQDGCDNFCTFCITRVARGKGISRPITEVIKDVRAAILGGSQEVVLTGVHLGSWGKDLKKEFHLRNLIEAILADTDIKRLRLSSLEPWDLDDQFFDLWKDKRLCRHLHLPLQSGSKEILKRMARKTNPDDFAKLVQRAREVMPDAAITTDIICGFPGETEEQHVESREFVRSLEFSSGHVFTYSAREGTPAARYPDQIPVVDRKRRNAEMRNVFKESGDKFRENLISKDLEVLWETSKKINEGTYGLTGLSSQFLRVKTQSEVDLWNQISTVKITAQSGNGLLGEI
ncbi:MAG: tRNA (N(6)-L-threonylcarbamoyladenosine(37)-C(2))-methylthiotransferase MtaB [Anaerolineaceae bacterium]|nr:tRNA (N(6)-L-threonylcarbamoyladenosine(37)-C(2))-methylthiotransferase MtaB [Anaerolineaceae bacterium]